MLAIHLIELVSHRSYEGMRTRRVIGPLLSQQVILLASNGSSAAGCTLPALSTVHGVMVCSPGVGLA